MRGGWSWLLYVGVVGLGILAATQAWSARTGQGAEELTIRVWKGRHEMWLEDGDRILKKFHVALGKNPAAGKLSRGDGRTPQGTYYICEKRPRSRFRRFLGISYPNIDDAERAFAQHLISADEWADIFFANVEQMIPPWSTAMGGRVGIHGYGGHPPVSIDWTEGCIAVSDADIDYLYDRVRLGTRVVISK
jgi:murein L,D-transpeptidase YafK